MLRSCGGESLTFALCRALLRAGGGKLTEERLLAFLDGFQTVCVLRQSELASLGAMLRCAVVSAIAEVAQLLSALFAALRAVPLMDLDTLTARVNVPGLILELDPTGEYPRMDALSKKSYLGRLERMAAARETDEQSLARALIERAKREGRHVGFFLFPENGERKGEAYIAGKTALTAALALLALYLLGPVGALLLLLPISETVTSLADFALSRLIRLSSGIPPEGKTLCVISTLLSREEDAEEAAQKLERLYYACSGDRERGALLFGLLGDLRAADGQTLPEDERVLSAAAEGGGGDRQAQRKPRRRLFPLYPAALL